MGYSVISDIGTTYWIGLKYYKNSNEWKWSNSAVDVTYTNWRNGDPSNNQCARLLDSGRWRDLRCGRAAPFVCEKCKLYTCLD